jgi:hypothetical protein
MNAHEKMQRSWNSRAEIEGKLRAEKQQVGSCSDEQKLILDTRCGV